MAKNQTIEEKIIQICTAKPSTGLEIQDRLNEGKYWFWQRVSFGTIYPTLHRLERDGYLRSY